jgi:hypothetical protein
LHLLAFLGGNMRRTAETLRDAGHRMSQKTIERWSQQQYPDAYAEVQAEVYRDASLRSLARAMQILAMQTESTKALERLDAIKKAGD